MKWLRNSCLEGGIGIIHAYLFDLLEALTIMDIELFESLSLSILTTALALFMGFIVYDLTRKSNAGRFGSFILFGALGLGVLGFIIKTLIYEWLL